MARVVADTEEEYKCDYVITGTCRFMCPEEEIVRREKDGLLSVLEIDHTKSRADKQMTSSSLAIKEFVRSGAGRDLTQAHLLRPVHVLLETMGYLLNKIVVRTDVDWLTVYNFVNNRLKCIAQDMTVQCIEGLEAVTIFEQMIRFYLYSQARLANESVDNFNPVLNHQLFQKCLHKLMTLYEQNSVNFKQRSEFNGYFILSYIGTTESFRCFYSIPKAFRMQEELLAIHKLNCAIVHGNFVRFFRLAKRLQPLSRSVLLTKVDLLRQDGLRVLNVGCGAKMTSKVPLKLLQALFDLPSLEAMHSLCTCHGLSADDCVIFNKADFVAKNPVQFVSQTYEIGVSSITSVSDLLIGGTKVVIQMNI